MLEMETYPGWPGGGSASVYAITYPPIFTKVGYSNAHLFLWTKTPNSFFFSTSECEG
jgi:hypothetical protein